MSVPGLLLLRSCIVYGRKGFPEYYSFGTEITTCNITSIVIIQYCSISLFQNLRVGDLTLQDGVQPVRYPHVRVADKFM